VPERDIDAHAETLAGITEDAGTAAHTLAEVRRPQATKGVVGKHFAHFRVERELGRGGMGEVYLATDLALDRPVALKLLPHDVAKDAQSRARFIREARAQAKISHPHICHIYFIGEQDEQLFFAMEYVDGENLQQRLDRDGKLGVAEAIEICREAAEGLREAHRHGFTHRDIKPSNLLVDRNGVVKLVDFGLVKSAAVHDVGETERGAESIIVGTPLYIAPEQARGDPVDFRADIYALGVTLHHLVAGKPPFTGDSALALVSKHLSDPRPALANRKSSLLDGLVDRMMAKRPDDRFATYDKLLDVLAEVAPDRTRPAGFITRGLAVVFDAIIVGLAAALVAVGLQAVNVPHIDTFPLLALLYGIFLPARIGATFGKRLLEIELAVEGRRGGIGIERAAKRFAVEWGPAYLFGYTVKLLGMWVPHGTVTEVLEACALVLGIGFPVVLGLLSLRSEGKRTLWDRLSGTRVVYEGPKARNR